MEDDDDDVLVASEHESRVDEPNKGWNDRRAKKSGEIFAPTIYSRITRSRFSETARTQWENVARAASRLPIN